MIYYCGGGMIDGENTLHEGIRFFPTETEAWEYINANEKQYAMENGKLVGMEVEYDIPMPVLYTRDFCQGDKDSLPSYIEEENAFLSNETKDYEFEVLDEKSWIIKDMDGTVRVWHPDLEETFFGKETDIVYEKAEGMDGYIKAAV